MMGESAGLFSLLGTAAGVGGQIAGSVGQAGAMRAQGQAARSIANVNAAGTELQAQDALLRGDQAIMRHGLSTRALLGQQVASAAGQGVSARSGTPAALQADTAAMSAADDATIKMNAYKEAMGLRMQASNQRFSGNMAYQAGRNNANNTLLAGGLGAARIGYSGLNDYYRYTPPLVVPSYGGLGSNEELGQYG